jgi:phosphoglycolate phosphatase-like HAD superfamily hydrolase
MHRLILWDIDGTLVSCGRWGRLALETGAVEAAGLKDVPHVVMGGKTDPQIVGEILGLAGLEPDGIERLVPEALAVAERRLAEWAPNIAEEGYSQPGVETLLARLEKTDGVRQSLVTGNVVRNARVKLAVFGLDRFVDFEVGAYGSDHAERDRLVPIALRRMRELRGDDYAPEEVWVIGDTVHDLRCARAAGTRCALVGTGKEGLPSPEQLHGLEADRTWPDLSDTEHVMAALLGR